MSGQTHVFNYGRLNNHHEENYQPEANIGLDYNLQSINNGYRFKTLSTPTNQNDNLSVNNSYSEIFLKKKEGIMNRSSSSRSIKNGKNINSQNFQKNQVINITPNAKRDENLKKNIITNSNTNNIYNIPPVHPQTTKNATPSNIPMNNQLNYSNFKQDRSLPQSQSNSIDLSQLTQDKVLSPKANYKFQNNLLIKSQSIEKLRQTERENQNLCEVSELRESNQRRGIKTPTNQNSQRNIISKTNFRNPSSNSKSSMKPKSKLGKNDSFNTLDSSGAVTSVNLYLQRRHTETQEKLQRLKNEKLKKEAQELRDRPKISENSKKIVERISKSGNQNVVERLTSKANERKKLEELSKLEEINRKNSKPVINETSEKLQRTIDDLYFWQNNLNEKREEIRKGKDQIVNQKPKINRESEELLKARNPDYLKNRVEDRLLQKGQM